MTPEQGEKMAAFTTELSALSVRLGVVIGGCGCCGSPWLEFMEERNEHPEDGVFTGYRADHQSRGSHTDCTLLDVAKEGGT